MPPHSPLSPLERRIVGVLLEKILATPAAYPLTLNALVAGANQKSNRDPEMTIAEDEARRALDALRDRRLVALELREGARTEKWKQLARDAWQLGSEKAMAILAELLVRGPQTKAELRAHASRMRHEISAEEVDEILLEWAAREAPLVQSVGRTPGGRAERFAHTFYRPEELAELRANAAPASPQLQAGEPVTSPSSGVRGAPAAAAAGVEEVTRLARALDEALARIAALEARVAALERG